MRRPPPTHRRPDGRRVRPGAFLARAVLLTWLVACRATGSGEPDVTFAPRPELAGLQAALAAGDNAQATALLDELSQGTLAREERAQLEAARNVLRGRELVAELRLALLSEESPTTPGLFELVLRAENRSGTPLTLMLPPCDLKRHRVSIDARGAEGLEFDSTLCSVLSELELGAGARERLVLLTYELPLGRAFAVRERWALATRSGEVRAEGRRYPAAEVVVGGCARERASPYLGEALPSEALAAALELEPAPDTRVLLQTALRIPPEQREQALERLIEPLDALAGRDPERVLAAEPALRWYTGNRDLGGDAEGWARYLTARRITGPESAEPRPTLDLPLRRD